MKIIAIDPGRYMGWATWDGERLRSGVKDLSDPDDDDMAARYDRAASWVRNLLIRTNSVGHGVLAYESQLAQKGHAKWNIGMQGVFMYLSRMWTLRLAGVQPRELKLWATGDGWATKAMMIERANAILSEAHMGETAEGGSPEAQQITDDNEADAVCILGWAKERLEGEGDADHGG